MPDSCGVPEAAPGWTPDWVFCPRERILSVVVEWIVSGFIAVGNAFVGAVEAVFASLGLAGATAGEGVVSSFANVGDSLLGVAFQMNNAILDMATSSGPAGPFVAVGLFVGVGFVLLGVFVGVRKGVLWIT